MLVLWWVKWWINKLIEDQILANRNRRGSINLLKFKYPSYQIKFNEAKNKIRNKYYQTT